MDASGLIALAVAAYVVLAGIDGVWLHLWQLRLHARPQSYGEHLLHTFRALLFPAVVVTLLNGRSAGFVLWFGAALALADFALVAWDAATETRSRRQLGGLPAFEAALHTVLQALHAGIVIAAIAVRPPAAWSGVAPPPPAAWLDVFYTVVFIGSCLVAVLHVALAIPALRAMALRLRRVPAG